MVRGSSEPGHEAPTRPMLTTHPNDSPVIRSDAYFSVTLPTPTSSHPRTPTNHDDFPSVSIPDTTPHYTDAPSRLATHSPSLPSAVSSSTTSSPSTNQRNAFASPRIGGRSIGGNGQGGSAPPSPRGGENLVWERTSVERQCGGDLGRMVDLLLAERNTLATQNAQLWKLMEKQRAQTTTIQKDIDRLRSERDRATYQLAQLEAAPNPNAFVSPNANRPPGDGTPPGIPNSASAIGLGIHDHHRAERQTLGGMAPAPSSRDEENVEKMNSAGSGEKPVLTRHHSDSNADSLAMREAEAYARETGTMNGAGSVTSMPSRGAPSPAFNPKSQARSRVANRTEGPSPSDAPPPEQLRTPLALRVVSPSETSPSEDTPRAALLPPVSIAATPTRAPISDSRISLEPEVKEILAMITTPETKNFPTIPAPQEAMAGSSSRAPPHNETSLEQQGPRHIIELDSASERSSHLPDEVPMTESPEPRAPFQHDEDLQQQQERVLRNDERVGAEPERRPLQPQLQEVKPLVLRHDTSGPSRQHSYASDSQDDHPSIYPRAAPTLIDRPPSKFTPQLLPFTRCSITSSTITPNAIGKDVLCFIIGVSVRAPGTYQTYSWHVAKLFSAFLELDNIVKLNIGGRKEAKAAGIAALSDGKSWKDFAPSKVDQRKATLEIYLQSLLTAPLSDKSEICGFLLTDITSGAVAASNSSSEGGVKSGYLTKRGKAFGGWHRRFFILEGHLLHYYESRGGSHLGTIPIAGAQIGRQHKNAMETSDGKAHVHAFLIIEAGKTSTSQTRHVLCAQSDDERDSWVDMLVKFTHGDPRTLSRTRTPPPAVKDGRAEDRPVVSRSGTGSSIASNTPQNDRGNHVLKAGREDKPAALKGTAQPMLQLSQDDNSQFKQGIDPSLIDQRGMLSTPPPMYEMPKAHHLAKQASLSSVPSVNESLSTALPSDLERQIRAGAASIDRLNEQGARAQEPTPLRNKRQSMMPPPRGPPPSQRPPDTRPPQQQQQPPQAQRSASSVPPRQAPTSPEREPHKLYRDKISAPQGGMAIPTGFKFGSKNVPPEGQYDRERKAKSGRFWGFGKSGNAAAPTPLAPPPVFGVPLEDSMAVASIANLPAVVFRCIKYLEERGAKSEEGIFRLSGSSAVIKALKDRFNAEGDVDLLAVDERWDLHAISGLLKLFFRDLPTSLLTRDLHMKFLAVMDLISSEERVAELAKLVSELPPHNYSLLRALTSHLILIVAHSEENKMNLRNIGIVFSPTLGIPAGIFSDLVTHFRAIFDVSCDGALPPDLIEDDEVETMSMATESTTQDADRPEARHAGGRHRNSQIYAASGADAMLGTSGRVLADQVEESDLDESQFSSDHGSVATGQERRRGTDTSSGQDVVIRPAEDDKLASN